MPLEPEDDDDDDELEAPASPGAPPSASFAALPRLVDFAKQANRVTGNSKTR
jgi:hypothetical protein